MIRLFFFDSYIVINSLFYFCIYSYIKIYIDFKLKGLKIIGSVLLVDIVCLREHKKMLNNTDKTISTIIIVFRLACYDHATLYHFSSDWYHNQSTRQNRSFDFLTCHISLYFRVLLIL